MIRTMFSFCTVAVLAFLFFPFSTVFYLQAQTIEVRPPFTLKWGSSLTTARGIMEKKDFSVMSDAKGNTICKKSGFTFGNLPIDFIGLMSGESVLPDKAKASKKLNGIVFESISTTSEDKHVSNLKSTISFVKSTYEGVTMADLSDELENGLDPENGVIFIIGNETTVLGIQSVNGVGEYAVRITFISKKMVGAMDKRNKDIEEKSKEDL